MPSIHIEATFDDLKNYVAYLHQGHKISFNDFWKLNSSYKDDDNVFIQANLSNIKFDENHKLDLTAADLSHTILKGLEFNGEYVILRNANLIGCDLTESSFTNHIDLTGTNLGAITLNSDTFKQCNLINAIYDPTQPTVAMVKVNSNQLQQYLNLRQKGVEVAQGSLNDYIAHVSRHYYPQDTTIIADLSQEFDESLIIDEKFSGADLSGTNLEGCTFTGKIEGLILRDCHFGQTLFQDCELIDADLRGTPLTTIHGIGLTYSAIFMEGKSSFINPKLSVSGDEHNSVRQAISSGVLSQDFQKPDFTIINPVLDPNYTRGSTKKEAEIIRPYRKFNIEDIKSYTKHCEQLLADGNKSKELPDFKSYVIEKYKIGESNLNFIPDLSNLDLSKLNLSNLNFSNTNMAYTKFNGANLENTIFDNCNLTGCDFSSARYRWFWSIITSLNSTSFVNSDLTAAKFNNVNASNANFNNVIALNIEAEKMKLIKAKANNANFAGSWLASIDATEIEANRSNLSYVFSKYAKYKKANLNNSNLSYSDFTGSDFTEAQLNYVSLVGSRLREANLTRAQFKATKLQADISYAILADTILENADIAGLFNEPEQEPIISNTDFKKTIESDTSHRYTKMECEQKIVERTNSIYNKYATVIIGAAIALPIIAVALINAFLPTAIIAAAVSTTLAISVPIVAVVSGAIIIDRIIQSKLNFNLGITTKIADFFGAKKVVKIATSLLDAEVQNEKKWLENYNAAQDKQLEIEAEIKRAPNKQAELDIAQDSHIQNEKKKFEDYNASLEKLENHSEVGIETERTANKQVEPDIASDSHIQVYTEIPKDQQSWQEKRKSIYQKGKSEDASTRKL